MDNMSTNSNHIKTLKYDIPMKSIVACRGPLLSSDREEDNKTTSSARQHIYINKQIYAAVTE
jgi:hypothetical protein